MYSHPAAAANDREKIAGGQVRAEMNALYEAGYIHDGADNWAAPDTDEFMPRAEAYLKLLEWD